MVSTGDEQYDERIARMLEFEPAGDLSLSNRPLHNDRPMRERSQSAAVPYSTNIRSARYLGPPGAVNETDNVHTQANNILRHRPSRKSFSGSIIGATLRKARSSLKSSLHTSDTKPKNYRESISPKENGQSRIGSLPPAVLRALPFGRPPPAIEDVVVEDTTSESVPLSPHAFASRTRVSRRPSFPLDPTRGAAARQAAREYEMPKSYYPSVRRNSDGSGMHGNKDRESGIDMTLDSTPDSPHTHHNSMTARSLGKRTDFIAGLPSELSMLILSHLDSRSLSRCERVSRVWQSVACDRVIWRHIFTAAYGTIARDSDLLTAVCGKDVGKMKPSEQDWKGVYRLRKELARNWATADEVEASYLHGHTDSVYCVQFDEDKIITGSRDRTIRVWDMSTYTLRKVIGVPHAYETDKREYGATYRLPLPSHNRVKVRRAEELPPNQQIYHVPERYHNASILCLQYDDEICVTGSSDTTLLVWDIKTWEPIRRLERHTAGVLDIAMDKRLIISCSKDSSLCIWDRQTGKLLQQLTGHRGPVNAVQLRENLIVSASGEGCAKIWRLHPQALGSSTASVRVEVIRDLWSEDRGLACVEFSEDAKYILAGGNDQVIYKFNSENGSSEARMEGHENLVRSLFLDSSNGRVISGSYDLSLRVWDFDSGKELLTFPQWATSWILSAKSDYRRIVACSQDGRVFCLDFGGKLRSK